MEDRCNLVISAKKKWNLTYGINDTVFDCIVNKWKSLKNSDTIGYKLFSDQVVGRVLFFRWKNPVPMKQPVKKLFVSKEQNTIYTLDGLVR